MSLLLSVTMTFANNKDYFFDKVTVKAIGEGKVYASTNQSDTPAYQSEFTLDAGKKSASSVQSTKIYLFAEIPEGYSFTWESGDYDLSDEQKTANPLELTISSQESSAKETSVSARFVKEGLEDGSLELSQTTLTSLKPGDTGTLTVASQSHEGDITWTSNAEGIVRVDEHGNYTVLAEGQVVITATLAESARYTSAEASCTLRAEAPKSLYQVQNGGFELWDDEDNANIEPTHWNSFQHASGQYASTVKAQQVAKSNDVRPGSTGLSSARIYARNVMFGIAAQGNLTTGRINGGSTSATDANGNYNYTDLSDADFNQPITGLPDAIHVWAKSGSSIGGAINCTLHTTGTEAFQDPVGDKEGHTNAGVTSVARAENSNIAKADAWQELTIPFEYNAEAEGVRPEYALVTLTTSGEPGKGSASDWMLIDDFEFIYNSELETATYDGQNIDFTDGAAVVDDVYKAAKLALTSNGKGAAIELSYDCETDVLTITVKGDNISDDAANQHQYTIQFNKPENTGTTYTDKLMVTINGYNSEPQDADIVVSQADDETYSFSLQNFSLQGMPVGNIDLTGVTLDEEGRFTTQQTIVIAAGTPADAGWIGPGIGEVPVEMSGVLTDDKFETTINIDFMEQMGQIIGVRFGHDLIYNYSRAVTSGKFGTLCLPFAYTAGNLSGATFYSIAGKNSTDGVAQSIVLEEVSSLEAGKPYIFCATADELKAVDGTGFAESAGDPTDMNIVVANNGLVGTFAAMEIPTGYNIYLLSNNQIVKAGEGCSIAAYRAAIYLDAVPEVSSEVKGLRLYLDGNTDGIQSSMRDTDEEEALYDLAGRRVQKAQKGIYVRNGKKMLVK
jgi:hypothetical protein